MLRLTVAEGARHPAVEFQAEIYAPGSAVFAGAKAKFRMGTMPGAALALERKAAILDVDGVLGYRWRAGDTAVPGRYYGEFTVTCPDGRVAVFPAQGFVRIDIVER